MAKTSLKNVIQSVHISSIASSSRDRVYAIRKPARVISDKSDVNVDFRTGSNAFGLVRLYIALNIAGIVFLGLDPSSACKRLKTVAGCVAPPSSSALYHSSIRVSRHSKASAANRCSSIRRVRFFMRREVWLNEADVVKILDEDSAR